MDAEDPSSSSQQLTSRGSLYRNQACFHCRHRKIKCDGQRPVCGPCRRAEREEDCEYTDNFTRARVELLEEDITRIQSRIYQLEHPGETDSRTVLLHDPYRSAAHMPALHQVLGSPTSMSLLLSQSHPTSRVPTPPDAWWNMDEPPPSVAERLIDSFVASGHVFGFFLDPGALISTTRPSPALLPAVYLAAVSISQSPSVKMHEAVFRGRALAAARHALVGPGLLDPHRLLHALQAEVILAWYFYAAGKPVEGLYHTATAVSLGVSSGIFGPSYGHTRLGSDPNADTGVFERVRIDACWAVVFLDRTWSVVMNTLPNWTSPVQTPWPGEVGVSVSVYSEVQTGDRIEDFISADHQDPARREIEPKELLAKASVLWEAASRLVSQSDWTPGSRTDTNEARIFFRRFSLINGRIAELQRITTVASDTHVDFLARNILNAAEIELHQPFLRSNPNSAQNSQSRARCLHAAQAILRLARDPQALQSNQSPLLSPIWASASRVLLGALRQPRPFDREIRAEFDSGFAAMRGHAARGGSLLMQYHLEKIREELSVLDAS
ncbi:hypothetical protein HMN09_00877100 [Mycena chlorophos]|uniref:Zn(2)-C6 fungal-type domain-containing protein n=1 Tax=Mycena chlorophos TaxID=658473 RepID=A0A8H6W4D7_MYCCL|nr:hypothetical protein HMN09_00877100 [Mycena chlorophos]